MFREIIYNVILLILVPTIFTLASMGIRYGLAFLKLKLADTKLAVAINWIDKMVKAAEQKFNSDGMGETKKAFVTVIITKILSLLKIKFSAEEVDALIEASVKELNDTTALIADKVATDKIDSVTKEDVKDVIDNAANGTVDTIANTIVSGANIVLAGATKTE